MDSFVFPPYMVIFIHALIKGTPIKLISDDREVFFYLGAGLRPNRRFIISDFASNLPLAFHTKITRKRETFIASTKQRLVELKD